MSEQLVESRPQSVKEFLSLPAYKSRFGEVLGQRAPQFMASLIQLTNDPYLARCEPKSVIASAMIAAVLDFPIEKSLGFAHIVPYGGVAQFQMAAKGYVQLALRSGQYQRLNAKPVNAEAFGGYDEVGEPRINWEALDETKPTVGYVVAWRLTNGFTKIAYWPKSKVEAHAAQFSQAYKKKKMDSPWFTNFDKMALKTVVMNELRAWGVLSVQMQTAMKHDMGAQRDVEAEVEYVDGAATEDVAATQANAQVEGAAPEPQVQRAAAPARAKRGASAVPDTKPAAIEAEIVPDAPKVEPKPVAKADPVEIAKATTVYAEKETPASAPAADPAPSNAPTSRAFLKDGEAVQVKCTVKEITTLMVNFKGTPTPSVSLKLEGEYIGPALHIGGASGTPNKLTPNAPWAPGATVLVSLRGKANPASGGKVLVRVDEVKAVEASPANPAMDVE